MADIDDVTNDNLLDSALETSKEEADDSVLSEIVNDSVVEDAEDPV